MRNGTGNLDVDDPPGSCPPLLSTAVTAGEGPSHEELEFVLDRVVGQ